MTIREITTKGQWDAYLLPLKPNTFLQSWEWGQVQRRTGEKVWCLGIFDGDRQVGACLVLGVHARRGNYFLIPHGPIVSAEHYFIPAVQIITDYMKKAGFSAVAMRIAPLVLAAPEIESRLSQLGFRAAPLHIHAELTWVLDCSQSDEQLLGHMRKTTRHAIRRAEKEGVRVDIITDQSGFERFWPLYRTTTSRHGFTPFPRDFIKAQVEEFSASGRLYIPIAAHQGQDVAGAIMIHYGDTVFYYHGASLKIDGHVPAAHLLHWHSIQEAKKRGAIRYNFWGIARDEDKNHPFAGITVFKKGFGGQALNYMHAQDLPLSPKYWFLWSVEMIRKLKRGF